MRVKLLAWLLLIYAGSTLAEVTTQLSRQTTSLDNPVRLALQITGENDASPDLSVLNQDFEILGRSHHQSVSTINGKTSKIRGLVLTLLPKSQGVITIPSIPVGQEASKPLTLEVTESVGIPRWNKETDRQGIARPPSVPLEAIPPMMGINPAFLPQPFAQDTNLPRERSFIEPGINLPEDHKDTAAFPAWLGWFLGFGWLATLLAWWLSHRKKKPPVAPPAPLPTHQPKDDKEEILTELDSAYEAKDKNAARIAWLKWGQYRWSDAPPGNLNRLAERLPQKVALAVIALDKAFYSPGQQEGWKVFNPRELLTNRKPIRVAKVLQGSKL